MKNKFSIVLILLVLMGIPDSHSLVDPILAPHKFNILSWELKNLFGRSFQPVTNDFCLSPTHRLFASQDEGLSKASLDETNRFFTQILEYEIRKNGFETVFPPVKFIIQSPPKLVIFSPRDKIKLEQTILLNPEVTYEQTIALEEILEVKTRKSVLVETLGGLAVYLSIISNTDYVPYVLNTAAHEWIHHRLFISPLGRRYFSNGFMKELNESVAQLAGNELGNKALLAISWCSENEVDLIKNDDASVSRMVLQNIRKEAETMLRSGEIREAEDYMEKQRLLLKREGYDICKLNQAYFAFHEMYGDSPASISDTYEHLVNIRAQVGDLKSFIEVVGSIKNENDFKELVLQY